MHNPLSSCTIHYGKLHPYYIIYSIHLLSLSLHYPSSSTISYTPYIHTHPFSTFYLDNIKDLCRLSVSYLLHLIHNLELSSIILFISFLPSFITTFDLSYLICLLSKSIPWSWSKLRTKCKNMFSKNLLACPFLHNTWHLLHCILA